MESTVKEKDQQSIPTLLHVGRRGGGVFGGFVCLRAWVGERDKLILCLCSV